MKMVGSKVFHTKYGDGIILSQNEKHILVKFTSESEIKKFPYPSCFQTFLKMVDSQIESIIRNEITEFQKKENERMAKEQHEMVQRSFERKLNNRSTKRSVNGNILRPFTSLSSFYEQFERALKFEIEYLKTNGGKRQRIFDGRLLDSKENHYIYSFETDSELNYPDGTQITLWQNLKSMSAVIISCEDFNIIFETSYDLGRDIESIEFSSESWKLIEALIERLKGLNQYSDLSLVHNLVCEGRKNIKYGKEITKGQDQALRLTKSQPITFIWGPPGTGKTETLAKIALENIERGYRVLMLSYSNVSVDGAILRVYKLDERKRAGKLVRYGYARDKALQQHEYLTTHNLVINNHPILLEERTKLLSDRKKASKTSHNYIEIGKQLTKIKNQLAEAEKTAVKSARFVATTVSKAIVDKTIYEEKFDVILFDEASMAYIPQIIFAGSLASKHFICMGDFAQLPPIVQSSSDSILNSDIFEYCGISDAVNDDNGHEWLCMLDTQFRMHPQIADFASRTMYKSLLKSDGKLQEERFNIVHSAPLIDLPLGLADLSGMMSVCTKTSDQSRINPLSAFVSFGLALQAIDHHEVGIITPYSAQSRLLYSMARDLADQYPDLPQITCATVHQFQGSEKDVIIYDAVDCYRQRFPGMLLTSVNNNYANRLFNVALTRAKGKFIAVANISYMENKNLSSNLVFTRLFNKLKSSKQSIEKKQFDVSFEGRKKTIYNWLNEKDGSIQFIRDIKSALKEIKIDIPAKLNNKEIAIPEIYNALIQANARGVKVCIRAESKNSLPNGLRQMAIENKFVANPIAIIDKKVIWFGEPLSDANFQSEGIVLPTRYRPIIRFEGKYTANSLYGFLEMSNMLDQSSMINRISNNDNSTFASYVAKRKSCSQCGRSMKLIKYKGKFFLGCSGYSECKNTELVDLELVEQYFDIMDKSSKLCSLDKTPLKAKLGPYGVYVQCSSTSKHRYNLDEI